MDDELEAEVLHRRAGAARARGRGADVAKATVKEPEGFAQPVDDLDVSALGRARERVALDLVDRKPAAEALGDPVHELGEDLARVLGLRTGDEFRVAGDVGHDQEPSIAIRWYERARTLDVS